MSGATKWRMLLPLCVLAATPLLLGRASLDSDLDRRVLAAHNRERAAVGAPPLLWDATLAADARRWADYLGATGQFYHAPDAPGATPQGENLWAGTAGYYTPESMVGLWMAEKWAYRPGVFPANSRTGNPGDISHYTQAVWRRTTALGCALAQGQQEEVLVCRYSQAGNVIGEQPL